ncbi:MAG: hypothetical protein AAF805_12445, partial [Planctomycetota bacterium]
LDRTTMPLSRPHAEWALAAVGLAALSGCTSMAPSGSPLAELVEGSKAAAAQASVAAPASHAAMAAIQEAPAAAPSAIEATPVSAQPAASQQEAFQQVAPMLQKIAAADPTLHGEVMTQLAGAPPHLWSLTVQQAERKLAYREQMSGDAEPAAEDATALAQQTPEPTTPATTPAAYPVVRASADIDQPSAPAAAVTPLPEVVGASAGAAKPQVIQNQHAAPAASEQPLVRVASRSQTIPAATAPAAERIDWQTRLDEAIARLAEETPERPGTPAEALAHARLGLLRLAKGDTDGAVAPPPGLSSAEQGYWSNQVFALAALLDATRAADRDAAAVAALRHQGEASAKLRSMAGLQVRNLNFCREVYGYGAYEPETAPQYRGGDQLILYAEIDNYASDETPDGYRTAIASSYRLVGPSGVAAASGDFPVVDDLCLTRRRDFHIQYGVALPETLAAGDYRLELTVTDRLGGKIGHSELPLTVAGR